MLDDRQLAALPHATDPAFHVEDDERWESIHRAHDLIAPIFWGTRISLVEACAAIREWIRQTFV